MRDLIESSSFPKPAIQGNEPVYRSENGVGEGSQSITKTEPEAYLPVEAFAGKAPGASGNLSEPEKQNGVRAGSAMSENSVTSEANGLTVEASRKVRALYEAELSPIASVEPVALNVPSGTIDNIAVAPLKQKHNKNFYLGVLSAINFDFANSFFKAIGSKDVMPGFGSGIALGWKTGKWQWETGISYSGKSYAPVKVTLLTGTFTTGYTNETQEEVELDMIQVPISLQYHWALSTKWDVYGVGGVTMNVSGRTVDNVKYSIAGTSYSAVNTIIDAKTDRQIPLYTPGILESGGALQGNFYLSTHAGFGVEYRATKRWSAFLQPTYQVHFGGYGIGPNADRINTLSWVAGAKIRL